MSCSAATTGAAVADSVRRLRIGDLQAATDEGRRWAMLTSYDQHTAAIFDSAGVSALLVGDSAANNVYGHRTTLPIGLDQMIDLGKAVVGATRRALVVVDLPFGSYEDGPSQALASAVRVMKETGCQAIKLEGGVRSAEQIAKVTTAGIPVMGHIGFTPQSEHGLGGYKVQGRGDAAEALLADAHAAADAGAFAVVLEMVPAELATRVTAELSVPTIGIGAGAGCDAQVLVWTDAMGMGDGRMPRFVKQYANLHQVLTEATQRYVAEVEDGSFPAPEHGFE